MIILNVEFIDVHCTELLNYFLSLLEEKNSEKLRSRPEIVDCEINGVYVHNQNEKLELNVLQLRCFSSHFHQNSSKREIFMSFHQYFTHFSTILDVEIMENFIKCS